MRWLQTEGPAPASPAPWCAACRHYGYPMTEIRLTGFHERVKVCEHPAPCRRRAETAGIWKNPAGAR